MISKEEEEEEEEEIPDQVGNDEVRGDGGERDKRVSRAFFCPRKLLSLSRKPECLRRNFFPLRESHNI